MTFATKNQGHIRSPTNGAGPLRRPIHVALVRTGLDGRLIFATVHVGLPSNNEYGFSHNLFLACSQDKQFLDALEDICFSIPSVKSTYARIGKTTNDVLKDAKGYAIPLYPFLCVKKDNDMNTVDHSALMSTLHDTIIKGMIRQDAIWIAEGKLKFPKIYADYSQVNDLTPVDDQGKLHFPTPDDLVTDNGLVTIARNVFGCGTENAEQCAENLSLFESQAFVQSLFSYKDSCGFSSAAIVQLGFPVTEYTPEDIFYHRLVLLLPALRNTDDEYLPRLLDNTLRSLKNVPSVSTRCSSKLQEMLDFIHTRPSLKKPYLNPFLKIFNSFKKHTLEEQADTRKLKRRVGDTTND